MSNWPCQRPTWSSGSALAALAVAVTRAVARRSARRQRGLAMERRARACSAACSGPRTAVSNWRSRRSDPVAMKPCPCAGGASPPIVSAAAATTRTRGKARRGTSPEYEALGALLRRLDDCRIATPLRNAPADLDFVVMDGDASRMTAIRAGVREPSLLVGGCAGLAVFTTLVCLRIGPAGLFLPALAAAAVLLLRRPGVALIGFVSL